MKCPWKWCVKKNHLGTLWARMYTNESLMTHRTSHLRTRLVRFRQFDTEPAGVKPTPLGFHLSFCQSLWKKRITFGNLLCFFLFYDQGWFFFFFFGIVTLCIYCCYHSESERDRCTVSTVTILSPWQEL